MPYPDNEALVNPQSVYIKLECPHCFNVVAFDGNDGHLPMVHETWRLEKALKNAAKREDALRAQLIQKHSEWVAYRNALNEIPCLPYDSNDHYIIAGNALAPKVPGAN